MKRTLELTSPLIVRRLHLSYTREPIRYSLGLAPHAIEMPYGNMQLGG